MKHWWHYLLLGIFAWLLFMVWRFPAPVAYGMFSDSLGEQLELAGLGGTLWQGEAQQLQYQDRVVASLGWQVSPMSLLLGRVGGEVSLNQGDAYLQAKGKAPISGGEVSLSRLDGRIPLPMIQPYLSALPLSLEGVASLKLTDLHINAEGRLQRADGRIVWHQAGVSALQKLQLGDLQMTLSSVDGVGIKGVISDSGGPLKLNATLTLQPDGAYQLNGQVKADDSASKALRNNLGMLGKADSQGNYPLNFQGSL